VWCYVQGGIDDGVCLEEWKRAVDHVNERGGLRNGIVSN